MFNHKFLLIALCCLLCGTVFANERSAEAAAEIAAQFTNRTPELRAKRMAPCSASSMRLVHTRAKLNSSAPAFYIFNQEDNSGYVVVSGDDYTEDILMYSDEGSLDYDNINPNLRFWLNRLQEQISHASAANAVDKTIPAETTTAIAPLLKKENQEIKWDQQSPYNNKCPTDPYDNTRCFTGCVATAAAMIMCKWSYPERGTGSRSYDWYYCTQYEVEYDDYGEEYYKCVAEDSRTISLDFSTTTYDWANMKATYGSSATSAQKNAVATLMYHCGVACEMQYGGNTAEGSGSLTDYMGRGFVEHFGYRATKFVSTMSQNAYEYYEGEYYPAVFTPKQYSVSTTTLKNYFNADLEAGRPILMGGSDPSGGHEFVCDGRDTNNRFHINWGWSGLGNAYCHLSALILDDGEDQYNFSSNIDAIIGLEPNTGDDPDPDDPDPDDPDPDTPTGEDGDFVLVTDAATLAVDDEVIIVNEEASVALSNDQRNNNRGQAAVDIVDNTITLPEETAVQILTLKAGTVEGTFAFYTGEGYLYAASSSKNYLRTQTTNDDNGSWEITISDGIATIIAQGESTRNWLRYNKANNGHLFSCYGSGQEDVAIYRRVIVEPDDPDPETPTAVEAVDSRESIIKSSKVLRDGVLYIIRGDRVYDVLGRPANH